MTKKIKKHRRTLEQIDHDAGPIASFVREQRKYLGYTQEVFAKRTGLGLRFIKELELGKPTLRMDKVNQVLNYLGAELIPVPHKKEE